VSPHNIIRRACAKLTSRRAANKLTAAITGTSGMSTSGFAGRGYAFVGGWRTVLFVSVLRAQCGEILVRLRRQPHCVRTLLSRRTPRHCFPAPARQLLYTEARGEGTSSIHHVCAREVVAPGQRAEGREVARAPRPLWHGQLAPMCRGPALALLRIGWALGRTPFPRGEGGCPAARAGAGRSRHSGRDGRATSYLPPVAKKSPAASTSVSRHPQEKDFPESIQTSLPSPGYFCR
jgi:hypothetical protein